MVHHATAVRAVVGEIDVDDGAVEKEEVHTRHRARHPAHRIRAEAEIHQSIARTAEVVGDWHLLRHSRHASSNSSSSSSRVVVVVVVIC